MDEQARLQESSGRKDSAMGSCGNKIMLTVGVIAGCNTEVQPTQLPHETEGGYGDTGDTDTDGGDPHECWLANAPAGAVRWQCEGIAEAAIFATIHVEISDYTENADLIQAIIDAGRIDWNELFGPWASESYDEPGIDACCSPEISSDEEGEGEDETGAGEPADPDIDIPQAAAACTDDCVDQACRQIPETLRELAEQAPIGIPIIGPSYRKQLRSLANFVAGNHTDPTGRASWSYGLVRI